MENVKKKNLLVLFLVICFLCSLFVGLFVIYNKEDEAVFADTGSESGLRFTLFNVIKLKTVSGKLSGDRNFIF